MHKFYYFLFLTVMFGCMPQENKVDQVEDKEDLLAPKSYEITSGLKIKEVKIDSTNKDYPCNGIRISFVAEASEEIFINLAEQDYSSFYVNTSLLIDDAVIFSKLEKVKSNYGKQIKLNKGSFFSAPGEHYMETVIPYFILGLPAGLNTSKLIIEIFPAKFLNEAGLHEYGKLEYVSNNSVGQQTFDHSFNAPELYPVKLTVKGFEIKDPDEKKGKFDFSFTGRGLPDPYWQIQCGETVIHTSKPVKNSSRFNSITSTKRFYYSKNDIFTITIFDFDQGPFNKKDIIGTWTGTMDELKGSSNIPDFGRVQKFNFHIE